MYVKYVWPTETSVWNDEGRKVSITTGMVFKTSTSNWNSYLKSKQFEEASFAEFDSQKKKPQPVEQPQEAPVEEPVASPVTETTVGAETSVVDEAPVAESKPKKK